MITGLNEAVSGQWPERSQMNEVKNYKLKS